MDRLVAGILAHVDAGKTTLSESMLFLAGNIKTLGRVDHKDAFLDNYGLERERGITIFSKQAVINWKDVEISLLDTPGHVDFSAEMERTLNVLDYAIFVISATDGVQPHTATLWKLLKRYNIPVFIFINKMDITNRDTGDIMAELKKRLDDGCINFTDEKTGEFYEDIAMSDERILDIYMEEGTISSDEIKKLVSERKIFPCYFGSALKMQGVEEFMAGFYNYHSPIKYSKSFGAKVYKIARDSQGTRLTYIKITGGSLKVRAQIEGTEEKAEQIRLYSGPKYKTVPVAEPGMTCAITGLKSTYPGEGLGVEKLSCVPVLEPVLAYRIVPEDGTDCHRLLECLRILEEEEPQLHTVWNEKLQEINIQLMGEVQLEVLQRLLLERFSIKTSFGRGNIVYKETITKTARGAGHFEPLRHYAEVHLLLEPGERGSGIVLSSECSEDSLAKNWQRLILSHLDEREHPGVLTGSAITDIKITLIAGKAHLKHTEGGDFRQATYRALRQGLMQAHSRLLEPYYSFRLEVPAGCIGRAMTDIQMMKGSFEGPVTEGEMQILSGEAPVSTMSGYMAQVSAYTGGKGRLSCNLNGYMPCHNEQEILEKTSYNPDEDIENPSGSVFCAHGAGFYVPWYEAHKYMHIEGIDTENSADWEDIDSSIAFKRQAGSYSGTIEEDKELEAIFERTFGPVARKFKSETTGYLGYEKRNGGKKKNTDEEYLQNLARYENKNNRKKKTEKSYLLVDGYNIIFSWEELNDLSKVSLDAARGRLMDILCNYQGYKQCTLILVFDAYKVKGNPGRLVKYHNIHVVYTKEAETADMYIEKVTHEIGKKHNVTVATSDALEQIIVAGDGAKRMSADEFKEEVRRVSERIKEIIENGF
ncbi:MAG TPA: translation elongation factor G [Lachnospiraceae bacterium]|nr:translation elongation factor G [Lachnospiraceae bacterium]